MTLTFNTHICLFFQLVSEHRLQMFWKINSFHFFLWKSLSYQIRPCRKICQGHSRVIIWTNYDGLESPMLHTKFRENRPAGSGEEDFWWAWRPSWSCDPDAANKLSFLLPKEAPHKIWLWLAKRFQRRRSLKLLTTDDDDGRWADAGPWVFYKLTYEPLAQVS